MRAPALALALAALAAAGCAGGSDDGAPSADPGDFISGLVHDVAAGRHDAAWLQLYPGHQEVAGRAEYARCEERDPFPGTLDRVQVLETFAEPVAVAGAGRLDSTAVRIRMTLALQDPFEQVFHAVAVQGRWTWFLPPARYDAYRAGRCP